MALAPGIRLGPYEIVAPLGQGGMGLVYKATDTRLGRTVAIKVSRDEFSGRFEREAHAVAALNHPHICQLYDVGSNYLVMEFVDGAPIQPPDDASRLVTLASQIADALVAAHAAGIVHRDLKPDNILVTTDGRVKVLDFGLATGGAGTGATDALVTQAATAVGTTVGTVAYMSPEQARGEAVDARSDLWSLGVVLYELATGARPFDGATTAVVFERILNQPPPALRDSGAHVPAGLSPIVAKLLEKDRARRYQSAADARADLTRLAQPAPESRRAEPSPSIAVLPFANLSADRENEYFGDGLAEEILNALAGIDGLKVIARTSAFAFRGKADDVRKIAAALGVATVLEGSVRRAGSRIRVTAQLIDATSGSQLWSERFDREMTDVFAVQDEIARAIVGTIAPTLGGAVVPASLKVNIEAYEAYLKGRYFFFTLTPAGVSRARAEYEKAIALDPSFAPAHAGLAGYFVLAAETGQAPASETMPRAKAAAQRAVELDATSPEGHAWLARIAAEYDYQWDEALRQYALGRASGRLRPEDEAGCVQFVLLPLGQADEAIAVMRRAVESDPLAPLPRLVLGNCLICRGVYDEAVEAAKAVSDHSFPYIQMGLAYTNTGRVRDAIAALEQTSGAMLPISQLTGTSLLAAHYENLGELEKAAPYLARLDAPELALIRDVGLAVFHMVRGNFEESAVCLGKAIDKRNPWASLAATWLIAGFASSEPGRAIKKRINLN